MKSEREKKVSSLRKKYHQRTRKKCKEIKRDIETQSQDYSIEKGNIRKILNKKNKLKKKNYQENPKPKEEYEKHKYEENPEPKRKYEKNEYEKNPKPKKENRKKMHKKNKKCLNKVEKFCQQIRQDPYFICTLCHRCLYKRSVRLFEHI